jgi:hypothetical protein
MKEEERRYGCFMHDGATAYTANYSTNALNEACSTTHNRRE